MNGKDIRKIFGSSLRDIRTEKGLKQEKLAELIGKQVNTINRIETGVNFVTSDTLGIICDVLNIHPSVLFTSKPHLFLQEHIDYVDEINKLLQTFPKEKLKEAYNILSVMNK